MVKQKCRFKKYLTDEKGRHITNEDETGFKYEWVEGWFHKFGLDCLENEFGIGTFSTAIIELEDGKLENITVEDVQMLYIAEKTEGNPFEERGIHRMEFSMLSKDSTCITICKFFREKNIGSDECQHCVFFRGIQYPEQIVYCSHE